MRRLEIAARRVARTLLTGGVAVLGLAASPAFATTGTDFDSSAPFVTFAVPGVADNTHFGVEGGEPVLGDANCPLDPLKIDKTAWWKIVGTGQPITLSTAGSVFNTVLAVYDTNGGAPGANRVACNDDNSGAQTSRATFASVRGKVFDIQVGTKGPIVGGSIILTASAGRPVNDDRIAASSLQTGVGLTISNLGASQEPAELLTCGTAHFSATTWFRWTSPGIGDVHFSSSATTFADTVLTVYRASDGAVVGCNDDAGPVGGPSQVSLRVGPGEEYLLQVGAKGVDSPSTGQGDVTALAAFALDPDADNDGVLASGDCNDANAAIRPGVVDPPDDGVDQNCDGVDPVNLDRDHDGYNRPGDCNDGDPRIHPLARDIPGNAIDEDCTGSAAPYPRLPSTVSRSWVYKRFHITRLTVNRLLAGSRIELRCRGGGCPHKSKVIKVPKAHRFISVLPYVKNRHLLRGSVLEVRVTKPEYIGVALRLTMRGAKDPKVSELCLPVGKATAKAC